MNVRIAIQRGKCSFKAFILLLCKNHEALQGKRKMTGFDRIRSFYMLTKPITTIIPLTAFIVGTVVATETLTVSLKMISGFVSLLLLFLGGCVVDDIGDKETDKKFHPNQPLVTENKNIRVSQGSAIALVLFLFIVGLSVAFVMLGLEFLLIMIAFPILATLYSIKPRITDWGILGNLVFVWFSVSLPFFAGAIAVGNISVTLLIASIILLLLGTGLDVVKDFVKYYEDKETERQSVLKSLGVNSGTKFIAMSAFLPYILSPILLVLLNLNIAYLFFAIGLCFGLIVLSGELLASKPPESKQIAQQMGRKNKILMLIAYGSIEMFLIGIVVGIL